MSSRRTSESSPSSRKSRASQARPEKQRRAAAPDERPKRPTRAAAPHEPVVDAAQARAFGKRLRAWFRVNGRDLPWRRTRDAYRILVSELMLQQTQVSRVVDYYERFVGRFPTLAHVARAHPDRVLEAWEGLGYYARARNLHRLAREVTDGGRSAANTLPAEPDALRALPGVGAYTAGAVASFAYERRAALVDTNVARVLQRVFAPGVHPKSTRGAKTLWRIAEEILPRGGRAVWTHNQALMELGALVCTARLARCDACPVTRACASYPALAGRGGPPVDTMASSAPVAITRRPRRGAKASRSDARSATAPVAKRGARGRDAKSL